MLLFIQEHFYFFSPLPLCPSAPLHHEDLLADNIVKPKPTAAYSEKPLNFGKILEFFLRTLEQPALALRCNLLSTQHSALYGESSRSLWRPTNWQSSPG